MRLPALFQRRRFATGLLITGLSLVTLAMTKAAEQRNWLRAPAPTDQHQPTPVATPSDPGPCPVAANPDPLLGPRTRKPGTWVGRSPVSTDLRIVVMAGHADSQSMASAGTPGFAVDVGKQAPMDSRMRDELYWNFKVQDAVVRLGLEEGLNIRGYTPPSLTIRNDNDPRTNWSQAKTLSALGHYVLEIHFDAYRPYGFGSGLIPAINRPLNRVDEQLGQAFGRFPRFFRGGLGGPRRGIGILEIGMLEPPLETKLRDLSTREQTINCLARRVVDALKRGVS